MATGPSNQTATPETSLTEPSYWWVGIAVLPFLSMSMALSATVWNGIGDPDAFVGVFLMVLLVVWVSTFVSWLLLPFFFGLDSKAIAAGPFDWEPNAKLWGVLGFSPFLAFVVLPGIAVFGYVVALCGSYLFLRHRHVGIP